MATRELRIRIFTTTSLRSRDRMERTLAALERRSFLRPTHWGVSEPLSGAYDAAAVRDHVLGSRGHEAILLSRQERPRSQAYLSLMPGNLNVVGFETRDALSVQRREEVFGLAEAWAEELRAELAFVHWAGPGETTGGRAPAKKVLEAYRASGEIGAEELQRYGLRALYARTWLGTALSERLGPETLDALETLGPPIERCGWGGIRLDLMEHPWRMDESALARAQAERSRALSETGLLGDYSRAPEIRRAPNWHRLPEAEA